MSKRGKLLTSLQAPDPVGNSVYAKLFSRITESSLMEEEIGTRYAFMMLLAISDPTGHVIGTDTAIARRINMPLDAFQRAIEALMRPDASSNSEASEGRRVVVSEVERGYRLVNYLTYRNTKSEEDRRAYMREYMRERRSAGKSASTAGKQGKPELAKLGHAELEALSRVHKKEAETTCPAEAERVVAKPPTPVDEVVDHYRTYHSHSRPGDKERKLIAGRLKDGYSVADLRDAIDGCHRSPFHSGINERGAKYQSLELIVRDSKHVAEFIEIARSGAKPTGLVNQREVEAKSTTARLIARLNLQGAENGTA